MPKDIKTTLTAARRKVTSELQDLFAPHMWESGYRIGKIGVSRPMKLWTPVDDRKNPKMVKFDGQVLAEFWGFSENGVITDIYCGCTTVQLGNFPIEDLLMLKDWALKNLPAARPAEARPAAPLPMPKPRVKHPK